MKYVIYAIMYIGFNENCGGKLHTIQVFTTDGQKVMTINFNLLNI